MKVFAVVLYAQNDPTIQITMLGNAQIDASVKANNTYTSAFLIAKDEKEAEKLALSMCQERFPDYETYQFMVFEIVSTEKEQLMNMRGQTFVLSLRESGKNGWQKKRRICAASLGGNMGTNFYWKNADEVSIPENLIGDRTHLGKCSAAGYFCHDCNVPLVQDGNLAYVHNSRYHILDACPVCGSPRPPFEFKTSSASVELGFSLPRTGRKITGIHSCCSFTWAQEKALIEAICKRYTNEKVIVDEYGDELTGQEFIEMVFGYCPIEFFDAIGREFS